MIGLYVKNTGISYFVMYAFAVIGSMEYMFGLFYDGTLFTNIYILQLFAVFIVSYICAVKRLGYLHLFSLLHITTFVFVLGGIVATPFSEEFSFRVFTNPLPIQFPEIVLQKVLILYSIYFAFTYLFFFIFNSIMEDNRSCNIVGTDIDYYKVGRFVMITMFPFGLFYGYSLLQVEDLRVVLFLGGSVSDLGVPLYLRVCNMFFTAGYYILLASHPPKDKFIKYSIIYFIYLIPILITGERGEFIVLVIFIIWYLNKVFKTRIALGKILIGALLLVVISYVLIFTRLGDDIEMESIISPFIGFLALSASSFPLLSYYVMFRGDVISHKYPFILDSLIASFTGASGQSMETLEARASIGHHLMYTLNPDYYLAGGSMGTSLIAEGFEFGVTGVIIGAMLLSLMIVFIENSLIKGRFRVIFLYLFFQTVILSPRGSIFVEIYDIIKYILIFCLFMGIYKFIRKYNYEKNS